MAIATSRTYRISDRVMMSEVGNEGVILDMEGGMYFGLNEVALAIWRQLEKGATIAEIESSILAGFDTTPETVSADVESLICRLLDARLLTPADREATKSPSET